MPTRRATTQRLQRFVVKNVVRLVQMAYTTDEVVELFEGDGSALDTICMEDSDDDLVLRR